MNKKIFTVFALFILIASISATSAFDLGSIFGFAGYPNDSALPLK